MKKIKTIVGVAVISVMFLAGSNLQAQDEAFNLDQLNMMRDFISLMSEYLTVANKFVTNLKDDDISVYLIAESMTEIYEKKGSKADAIPALRKLAEKNKGNKVAYKAILFKIKDIYKENQEYDKALAVLVEVSDVK